MGRIPEETIQTIRDRVDVVELIGRHVALKKAGRSYKGLCPFHDEKTPSFHVNPERGAYHCFGCGEGGNAFGFVMRHENLTFPEAVRALAGAVGVEVPEARGGDTGVVERVLRVNALAHKLYRESLRSRAGAGARAYLERRGLGSEEIDRYGVGWAPPGWDDLAKALSLEKIPAAAGVQAGLLRERDRGGFYDLMRDRVTFPIEDVRGRVIGLGGRALGEDQEPKYLNSPETPVFRKREAFYGFPRALEPIARSGRVILVEGYFDQIALDRAGLGEALATCGTALSDDHAHNLRRRTRNVVLLFDGDTAGRRAALRALELLLPHGLRVRAAALPPGEDPDTILLHKGAEALRTLVDGAPPALELAIEEAVATGSRTPEEKADAVAAIVPLLAKIPDPTERSAWCQRVALAVGGREADVLASVRAVARGALPEDAVRVQAVQAGGPEERQLRQILQALLQYPGCVAAVGDEALLLEGAAPLWTRLFPEALEACREGRDLLAGNDLDADAQALLHAVAAGEGPSYEDEAHARRAVAEIVAGFERRRRRDAQRAMTDRLRGSSSEESLALLRRKFGAEAT